MVSYSEEGKQAMKINLRMFIDRENQYRKSINLASKKRIHKLAHIPTCLDDSKWIIESLEAKLSPENLYEDHEISNKEAQEKETYFLAVHAELEELINQKIDLNY
jgi:hypothetical protein